MLRFSHAWRLHLFIHLSTSSSCQKVLAQGQSRIFDQDRSPLTTATSIDGPFGQFLQQLRTREPRAWNELVTRLRPVLKAYLRSRIRRYSGGLLNRNEFTEEVIEETLLKFFELFEDRHFERYEHLEATVMTIAKYKLKEGFGRLRRERERYAPDERPDQRPAPDAARPTEDPRIGHVHHELNKLPATDQELLLRYFNGEELRSIASDLGIAPAACRKRKQRLTERLRSLLTTLLTGLIFWL